jgi:hypothetical protein
MSGNDGMDALLEAMSLMADKENRMQKQIDDLHKHISAQDDYILTLENTTEQNWRTMNNMWMILFTLAAVVAAASYLLNVASYNNMNVTKSYDGDVIDDAEEAKNPKTRSEVDTSEKPDTPTTGAAASRKTEIPQTS